jgi:hypothetical protein
MSGDIQVTALARRCPSVCQHVRQGRGRTIRCQPRPETDLLLADGHQPVAGMECLGELLKSICPSAIHRSLVRPSAVRPSIRPSASCPIWTARSITCASQYIWPVGWQAGWSALGDGATWQLLCRVAQHGCAVVSPRRASTTSTMHGCLGCVKTGVCVLGASGLARHHRNQEDTV